MDKIQPMRVKNLNINRDMVIKAGVSHRIKQE